MRMTLSSSVRRGLLRARDARVECEAAEIGERSRIQVEPTPFRVRVRRARDAGACVVVEAGASRLVACAASRQLSLA